MNTIWQFVQDISWFGNLLRGIADISIIWVAFLAVKGSTYKTVSLSVGNFRIRRRDCNVQNVTNLVSMLFFDGGTVPDLVRKEIIEKTAPKVKNITRK